MNKKIILILEIIVMVFVTLNFFILNSNKVNAAQGGCCEKTNTGAYCQNVDDINNCYTGPILDANNKPIRDYDIAATSCDSTSFCKLGCGYDTNTGRCYANTPQAYALSNGQSFSSNPDCSVPQCAKGCCIIGNQAQLTTQILCKQATANYPELSVNFDPSVTDETACINKARSQDKGCCVADADHCTYTTRDQCNLATAINVSQASGFYKDTACSDTSKVNCHVVSAYKKGCLLDQGLDSVYYFDSAGNVDIFASQHTGNDPNKYNHPLGTIKDNTEGVAEYCDYVNGDLCGLDPKDNNHKCMTIDCSPSSRGQTNKYSFEFTAGDYGQNGGYAGTQSIVQKDKARNGESWCLYDTQDQSYYGPGAHDPVGSRYYRSVCINGKELIEPCADFRKEFCIDNDNTQSTTGSTIPGASSILPTITANPNANSQQANERTEARCVENRAQDCTTKCNTANSFKMSQSDYNTALQADQNCCNDVYKKDCYWTGNKCVPQVTPGAKFWNGENANTCAKANLECPVVFACNGWDSILGACTGKGGVEFAQYYVPFIKAAASGVVAIGTGGLAIVPVASGFLSSIAFDTIKGSAFANTHGWHLVAGGECLNQSFIQAANNLCRSYGDCGANVNYDNTRSDAGFVNTGNLTGDFLNSPDTEGYQGKPGILSNHDLYPDLSWDEGADFFNFTVSQYDKPGFAQRFFTGTTGEWYRSGSFVQSIAGASGLASYILWGGSKLAAGPIGSILAYPVDWIKSSASTAAAKAPEEALTKFQIELKDAGDIATKFTSSSGQKLTIKDVYDLQQSGNLPQGITQETLKNSKAFSKFNELKSDYNLYGKTGSFYGGILSGINAAGWVDLASEAISAIVGDQVSTQTIKTTCQPWQAPVVQPDTDPCQRCNPNYKAYNDSNGNAKNVRALKTCSEYQCKSLGATCTLLNQGTGNETCVNIARNDVSSPVITPWSAGFTPDYLPNLLPEIGDYKRGFLVTDTKRNDGKVGIYNTFTIGIQTDKPAQCKVTLKHGQEFKDISNYFGNDLYSYYHLQFVTFLNGTGPFNLQTPGLYNFYVRCQDGGGNANEADYVIRFNVETGPDLTPPVIEGTSITPGSYIKSSQTTTPLSIFVNKQADCRWDARDEDYGAMPKDNSCRTGAINALNLYDCDTTLSGLVGGDATNNIFIRCNSTKGNVMEQSYQLALKGSIPLTLTNVGPTGVILSGATTGNLANVTLQAQTADGANRDGTATCSYNEISPAPLSGGQFSSTNAPVSTQVLNLIGDSSGVNYKFSINCVDAAGNIAQNYTNFTVVVRTAPPVLQQVYRDESTTPPHLRVVVDENSNCEYSNQTFTFGQGTDMPEDNSMQHDALYNENSKYYILCKDVYGNAWSSPIIIYT